MRMRELSRTGIKISELALGSTTWGTQNTTLEGHAQIDRAMERGVNIIDTAEMYPVNPLSKETQGDTQKVIGEWVAKNPSKRGDVLLATKVSGSGYENVREGAPISRDTIHAAIEASLRDMRTDYIDLYQLHWPNRGSFQFRQNWNFDATGQDTNEVDRHMAEVLTTMADLQKAGKVRHFGLSNESAWGCTRWCVMADTLGAPRPVSTQNEYSLMYRSHDTDMAEMSHHEKVDLLSFSPLATGILSGKYLNDQTPQDSRRTFVEDLGGRMTRRSFAASEAYLNVAKKHSLNPCQMALAWCRTRPFMGTAIFGSTTMEQLDVALGSVDVELSDAVLTDIDNAHRAHPQPY